MRKLQKAAVVVAMIGSVGFIGAGTAVAGDGPKGKIDITQANECRSHDVNIALLNNIGLANGVLGNALGGEGDPGAQTTSLGSTVNCTNAVGG